MVLLFKSPRTPELVFMVYFLLSLKCEIISISEEPLDHFEQNTNLDMEGQIFSAKRNETPFSVH